MQIGIRALDDSLSLQKKKQPLIHCINNSSEMLKQSIISYNGNPIFINLLDKNKEYVYKGNSLLISLKDLNEDKIENIERAIRIARRKGISIILDILGVNISFPIKEIALRFINRYNINVVIGNIEEFKVLVLNDKDLNREENFSNNLRENKELRISLRKFARIYSTIIVLKNYDYYLSNGFSEFFINRDINNKDKKIDVDDILSGLISVGVASASNTKESFISVLVAIMTMAVSEKKVEQKIINSCDNINLRENLQDEIKNINADELSKLSKVDYLFIR